MARIGDANNDDGSDGNRHATTPASAYPSNSIINLFHLGYRSLMSQLSDIFADGDSSSSANTGHHDDQNKEVIRCFCFPCIKCGIGERGRANVKTVFGLIFVPFFLLSFFLLDDVGKVMVRNMQLRQGSAHMSNRDETGVIDFHLNRRILKEFPGHKREVLLLSPSLDVQGRGGSHSFEALIKCPRGILFMFHGCGRYAASFFYSPQGRKMVEMATQMGLGIVAFTKSEELGCWNWANDGDTVQKLAKKFLSSRLGKACAGVYPPLYAFGASSGGSFVGMLSSQMKQDPEEYAPFLFSAVNIQIMAPNESDHWDIPTVFTVMNGDAQTAKRVKDWTNSECTNFELSGGVCMKHGEQVNKGPYKIITTSGRKPIHNTHFAHTYQDDPQMSDRISGNIHQDLSVLGVINSATDEILVNPRFSKDAVTSICKNMICCRGKKWQTIQSIWMHPMFTRLECQNDLCEVLRKQSWRMQTLCG